MLSIGGSKDKNDSISLQEALEPHYIHQNDDDVVIQSVIVNGNR